MGTWSRTNLSMLALAALAFASAAGGCDDSAADADADADADGDADGGVDADADGDVDADADGDGDVADEPEPWVWVDLSIALPAGAVIDPKLSGEPALDVVVTAPGAAGALPPGCVVMVEALGPSGQVAVLADEAAWAPAAGELALGWSGRDDDGGPFDPGPVQLAANLYCTERVQGWGEAEVWVVRLGVTAVDFQGDTVALAYHKLDLARRGLTLLGGEVPELLDDRATAWELADLDLDDGSPRQPPAPWENPDAPPWGDGPPGAVGLGRHNVPAAYVAGATVELEATFGAAAVSAASGVVVHPLGPEPWRGEAPAIRVALEGFEPVGDATWAPGGAAVLRASAPLPAEVGRHELVLHWRFEALDGAGGAWVRVPGEDVTTHRLYLVAGASRVPDGTSIDASPPVAWIGVLDDVADAIAGLRADDPEAIMTALRQRVHDDPRVIYNPGDGAYSDFEGDYLDWDYIWIEMSDWLDRTDGIDLYCHSMACLLSSLANHLGLDARYVTLGRDFHTHLTRAAGESEWLDWDFNSHGVTTLGDTGLIWDAAVDFDGDADPDSEPVTPVQPVAVPQAEYLGLLTADPIGVLLTGTCFVY
jgi:hypothetical protein